MDATIYRNVADIHLKSMAYLTVTIIYRFLKMYKHSNHAAN